MSERPLYRTIAASIQARISAGNYGPDAPLPPEPLLEKEFGVSRITIRRALGQLKQRGLIYSRSGKGTIVRPAALASQSMKMTGSISDLSYYAANTVYSANECRQIASSRELAAKLDIPLGDKVLYMSGTRGNVSEDPFAFEEIYVPKTFAAGVDNSDLTGRTVFGKIQIRHGVSIVEVHQAVTAVMPPAKARRALGLSKQQWCLKAARLYLGRDGRPVELSITYYDSTRFEYTTVLYAD